MKLDTPRAKQIVVAGVFTLLISVLGWMLFAGPAGQRVKTLRDQLTAAETKLSDTERKARMVEKFTKDLADFESKLDALSTRLVKGDKYLWVIRSLAKYQIPGSLEFTEFDQPVETDWGLPGAGPLKAASFLVKGVGTYQELGKFTAALENDFPAIRFRNITVSPKKPLGDEKVEFILDFVGIISPQNSSQPARGDLLARQ